MVQLGQRRVQVDTDPLPAASANFSTKSLDQSNSMRLVLKPSIGSWLFSLVFVFLGSIAFVVGTLTFAFDPRQTAPFMFMGIGALFAGVGLGMIVLAKRIVFDRGREEWYVGGMLRGESARPLSQILAVQLLFGGRHYSNKSSYVTYQLNLIIDDESEPRINLTNHANVSATTEAAKAIAGFLEVPLLDELSESD